MAIRQKKGKSSRAPLVAVIGDVVESRKLTSKRRQHLQTTLAELLGLFNEKYRSAVISEFLITLGDECQGLLGTPEAFPELLWMVETTMPDIQMRWGVGLGRLVGPVEPRALGMDGPAFHNAREGIIAARKTRALGGVFVGFGLPSDTLLNGFARVLHRERSTWSEPQREVIGYLRVIPSVSMIAEQLGLSRQDVSKKSLRAGGPAYLEGERAWKTLLAEYDMRERWGMRQFPIMPAVPPAGNKRGRSKSPTMAAR